MAYFDRKDDYAYVRWAREVKIRDHFSCVICGIRQNLNSHHLNAWAEYPDQRYDVENGVTLCSFHHEDFHERYGKGKNTSNQFEEYREVAEVIIKVANDEAFIQSAAERLLQQAERDLTVEAILKEMEDHPDGYEE